MRIGIAGSMHFTEKMLEVRDQLQKASHKAYVTSFAESFVGKSETAKEQIKLKQKDEHDVIKEFWEKMQGGDALLVINLERKGIPNYIGGNTLMEIGFAHVLGQKIFLWNPIPDIAFYKSEIKSVNPIVIDREISLIK